MKKEARHLYEKAVESLILSVELFNRPNDCGRIHGVLIFMDHAFEMILKAAILHKKGKIRERSAKETIGFSKCIRKAFSSEGMKFLDEEEVLILQTINGYRDAAQHYILQISEQMFYSQIQAGLTLFRDIALRVFRIDLKLELPIRVLPLSTTPPTEINSMFSTEVNEIKKLLYPRTRRNLEAMERLRSLAIMENSIQGIETQPSTAELRGLSRKILSGMTWEQIFPGASTINFTSKGYGPSLDIRITKSEDAIPFTRVPEGTPGAAVVAIKRVNELDHYNLGRDQVAAKLNLSKPKTTAAISVFKIKTDPDCYKLISIGKAVFDRYSQKAIMKLQECLSEKSIDDVWVEYRTNTG